MPRGIRRMSDQDILLSATGSETEQTLADWLADIAALQLAQGTWTPTITFATPGDLAVVYDAQVARYIRVGNWVWLNIDELTFTATHTNASGGLNISVPAGLTPAQQASGSVRFVGTSPAYPSGATSLVVGASTGGTLILNGQGAAASPGNLSASQITTEVEFSLRLTVSYPISA